MHIVYYTKESWEETYVREHMPGHTLEFRADEQIETKEIEPGVDALAIFVHHPIGEAHMSRFPDLKLIVTRSTGFDHIDMVAARKRGIVVCSVPAYGANTVAEFAFGLLLALSRLVVEASDRVRRDHSFSQEGLRGFDLAGKTLGILGTGRIGAHMATMAHGFGMRVVAYDARPDASLVVQLGVVYLSLEDVLAQADILSLHLPNTQETTHLLNAKAFAGMKRGVYVINTARGSVIDTGALVEALESGVVAGAGLDVLEEEGDMADELRLLHEAHPKAEELRAVLANHRLLTHPRVIVTPHVAFNTEEAVRRIADTTIENIQAFVAGAPKNVVV